jgi:hypothetical protein
MKMAHIDAKFRDPLTGPGMHREDNIQILVNVEE